MQLTFAVFLIGLVGFVDSSTSTSSKSSSSKSSSSKSSKSSKSSSSTSYEPRPYPDYPSSLEEAKYFFLCEDNFFQAVTKITDDSRRLEIGRWDLKEDSDLSLWEVAPTAYLGDIMSRKLHFDELSSDTTDPYSEVMSRLVEDKEAEMSRLSRIGYPSLALSSMSERQEYSGFGTICQNHGGIAAGGCSALTPIECILQVCGDTGQGRCCVDKSSEVSHE